MEITTVHYQKLVNLGDYQNERVGAWANVGASETAEEALEQLTEWVLARIDKKAAELKEAAEMEQDLLNKRYDLHELEGSIARAQEKWDRIVKFFAERQISLPERWSRHDDIPF